MPNFIRFFLIKLLSKLLSPYVTLSTIATVDLYHGITNSQWVFDDTSRNIVAEGFSPGIGEMIERILVKPDKDIDYYYAKKYDLSFSSVPFEGYQAHLFWVKNEDFGNWYTWKGIRGWLCPVLQQYYPIIPQNIYVRIVEKEVL